MLLQQSVSSVGQLIEATRDIAATWHPSVSDAQELWFRGQPRRSFPLLPGLYRPNVQRYHFNEATLFGHFKSIGAPYTATRPANDWEWCFLAQHYGLPTRLLDWTQNLLAAAYFAVCDAVLCRDRLAIDDDRQREPAPPVFDDDCPVVWIIDAGTLNRRTINKDIVVYPGGELTSLYLPENLQKNRSDRNKLPLALFAPRANVRIAAQQGTFTIHGHDDRSLDTLALEPSERGPIELACVTIDRANIARFWHELQLAGVGKLALFPDLDSVALHVKWLLQSAG